MGFDHQDYWPLLGISSLARLHCYGDDACSNIGFRLQEDGSTGYGEPPDGYLGAIQEVCMDASSSGPRSLYSLCRHVPQLQALRMSHRQHSQDPFIWGTVTEKSRRWPTNARLNTSTSSPGLLRLGGIQVLHRPKW
jgi:hypothetical protein